MAITKIGTKLINDGAITTVKLGSSAVTRSDIQSGSVQVTHLDVTQGQSGHVDFLDDDFLIAGDATNNDARGFSFSQLKTALSLSNAARGDEGTVQYNNGTGFDGISKIRTDGVHLTASDAGKVVFAYTGISGSTGEIFADSKTGLTIKAKTRLSLHSSGAVQGIQSGSVELRADGLFPSVKPATSTTSGVYIFRLTSGSTGRYGNKTYGPVNNTSQFLQVAGTGSNDYIFFLTNAGTTNPPSAQSVNYDEYGGGDAHEIAVEAHTSITDWRDVAQNFYNAMNTNLPSGLATVAYSAPADIDATASITVTYASGIAGGIKVGSGNDGNRAGNPQSRNVAPQVANADPFNVATDDSSGAAPIQSTVSSTKGVSGEPKKSGVFVETTTSGSQGEDLTLVWLNLGASGRKYNEVYANVFSGSGTSQIHKVDADEVTANRIVQSGNTSELSGSGTATLHNLTVEEGTFGGVKFSSVRDAAAYALSGSGTASIHKLDADEGDFRKVISSAVTGSGTHQIHKVDADLGTIDRVSALVVTGSGTSQFHKVDVDEGTHNKVVTTNITGSGLAELHNLTAGDVSGSIGEFHHMNVDHVTARVINSTSDTVEHLEVNVKQLIPAVSQSAGASQEGAGLQIGGTAGSGSAGIASVILGDAGSGAGADLLFKIGATQGASLSGSVSDGGQRFGVSGTLSASIGVFHDIAIAKSLGAQDSIFSGSSFNAQTISGSLARIFDVDVNRANINDVDGTSATFTTVSGTTVQAHTADADKLTANDVDGVSMTITGIVSGSTVDAHTIDVDKLEVRDLDFTNLSGSGTATIHKVTSDVLSGSATTLHSLDVDKLAINSITTNDVVKKAQLNNDIVKATSNAHGGLVFANGQLSVGHKRRIFSRSTKALINRTQPTQGSGSLYTTCSLGEVRMVSGSDSVFFNGLLLTRGNGVAGNTKDADYTIDYSHGGGLQPGVYKFMFTSGSTGKDGGTDKVYGPGGSGKAQYLEVKSSGSENYLFFLSDGSSTTEPFSNSLNIEFGSFDSEGDLRQVRVESVSTITDWRTVVTNFYNAMNTSLPGALASVALSGASQISHTASITVTYAATGIEGGIAVGAGKFESLGSGVVTHRLATAGASRVASQASTHGTALANEQGHADGTKKSGDGNNSGVFVETVTSGSTAQVGTGIFLSENLAMDSDDVVVVQYLSGSHQF